MQRGASLEAGKRGAASVESSETSLSEEKEGRVEVQTAENKKVDGGRMQVLLVNNAGVARCAVHTD